MAFSNDPRPSEHLEKANEPEKKKNIPTKPGLSRKRRAANPLESCFMSKKKRIIKAKPEITTSSSAPPPKCMALVLYVPPIVPAKEGQDDDLFGDEKYDSDAFKKEFGYGKEKEKKKDPAPSGHSDKKGYFTFTGRREEFARETKYKSAYNDQFTNVFAPPPPPMSQEAEYIQFKTESDDFFAPDADTKSVPFPTVRSNRCTEKDCLRFKKLGICQHDIERVLKGCRGLEWKDETKWIAFLKKEGRKWHTDKFVNRKEWEEKAKEMFQAIGALVDEKKEPMPFVEDPKE
ncbi:uncharacterized protein PAC_17196 [Phialocephala subalpina]|uniref:Uncharacterized protein n=1 Tax=Phialocephala subalpina TaxID=576137 RepID=A0A1L7XQT7_9HELO|nr:uncharacterized protein PAC_17196 [Phialocephala subalpina]